MGLGFFNYEDLFRSLYFFFVGCFKLNIFMIFGLCYIVDDVRSIVDRLLMYDLFKVLEFCGQFVKFFVFIVYKKKYSEGEVQFIVDRLLDYDLLKGLVEFWGIFIIVC